MYLWPEFWPSSWPLQEEPGVLGWLSLNFLGVVGQEPQARVRKLMECGSNVWVVWNQPFYEYLTLSFFFWPHCTACGILVPWCGIEPVRHGVLTTAPPGESLNLILKLWDKPHWYMEGFKMVQETSFRWVSMSTDHVMRKTFPFQSLFSPPHVF